MRKKVGLFIVLVMLLSAMFLTTSCAKKKVAQTEPVSMPQPEVQKVVSEKPTDASEKTSQLNDKNKLEQEALPPQVPEKKFNNENIHFAFDSSDLSDEARDILKNNADYLRLKSKLDVTVEGHCDARGTDTYNIALGKRRAESVKKFLVGQGIKTDRIVTVSYGENKPIASGQDETSWAKNRRAQILITLASDNRKAMAN